MRAGERVWRAPVRQGVERLLGLLAALVVLSILAAGCADDSEIAVTDAWARPTPPGAEATAIYLTVENTSGTTDALTGALSDRCSTTGIHETVMTDGTMSMEPASPDAVTVADGDDLVFEPGGLHVMCIGVTEPLVEADSIELELIFQNAGVVDLVVLIEQR